MTSPQQLVLNLDPAELAPRKRWGDIAAVANDRLDSRQMLAFTVAAIEYQGLVDNNKESYNELLDSGIERITTEMFRIDRLYKNERDNTEADREIKTINLHVQFEDVKVGYPQYATYYTGDTVPLFPERSRLAGQPYSGPLSMGEDISLVATKASGETITVRVKIPVMQIAQVPIMLGSNCCHTHNATRETLKQMHEDPNDKGGYFIAKQLEYAVGLLENTRFNTLHVHRNVAQNELVRGDIISQPGGPFEHSSQLLIRFMQNGAITIEINSTKLAGAKIPFYILYRLFGMTSDENIMETIAYNLSSQSAVAKRTMQRVGKALQMADKSYEPLKTELNRAKIIQGLAVKLSKIVSANNTAFEANEHAISYLNASLLKLLDTIVLPHMGTSEGDRAMKLRFLGSMIHDVDLVEQGIMPPTDRDNYAGKRVHGPGVSMAKSYKTQFNNSIISPLLTAVHRELKNNPFSSITPASLHDLVRNAICTNDLNRAMEKSITASNAKIVVRRKVATNRAASNPLERKNELNLFSTLRTISTHNAGNASKQTERADRMRRVHPSYIGYVCVAQSADTGEKVGVQKQLALTATVCAATSPTQLMLWLAVDPEVLKPHEYTYSQIETEFLALVAVNGRWIGAVRNPAQFVQRYRLLRREGRVLGRRETVEWNPVANRVGFWTDVGRLTRPLLIVDNNLDEYRTACHAAAANSGAKRIPFIQNTRFTTEMAHKIRTGELGLVDLIEQGVAEYITPEEAENCLIAYSNDKLREDRHNVTVRYTHVDIEQNIMGLAALISPYGNHTQPARVTYETNQSRQTGGWFTWAFAFRMDKNRFWQISNEIPLVRTISHQFVLPNGVNCMLAHVSGTGAQGNNQEDSAVVCRASADRGLFAGAFYRYYKVDIERGEEFRQPDPLTTKNIRPNASYSKLQADGFIREGTIVTKGTVLIGVVAKLARQGSRAGDQDLKYTHTDRSVSYRLAEPAIVDKVIRPRGADGEMYGLVRLRYVRHLIVGDKISSRSGNKNIIAEFISQSDMPYIMESGITPDLLVNMTGFPTRMTLGQMIELGEAQNCSQMGTVTDGTAFIPTNFDAIGLQSMALGMRYNGRHTMINGRTGEYFDAAIFVGPTYEQRLLKFVLDDAYAVAGRAPTDSTTGQPLRGGRVSGGLRFGEMEFWCLNSHGSMANSYENSSEHSDGRVMDVCRGCGDLAIRNERSGIYACRLCKENADITSVETRKTAVVLMEELAAANVKIQLGLSPREFELPWEAEPVFHVMPSNVEPDGSCGSSCDEAAFEVPAAEELIPEEQATAEQLMPDLE
jgi:DNA-directed RNA polymerase beta subunit